MRIFLIAVSLLLASTAYAAGEESQKEVESTGDKVALFEITGMV